MRKPKPPYRLNAPPTQTLKRANLGGIHRRAPDARSAPRARPASLAPPPPPPGGPLRAGASPQASPTPARPPRAASATARTPQDRAIRATPTAAPTETPEPE